MRRAAMALLFIGASVAACKHGPPPPADSTASYFPLAPGNFWRYELDGAAGERELVFRIASRRDGGRGEERFLVEGRDEGNYHFYRRGDQFGVSVADGLWTVYLDGELRVGRSWPGGLVDDSYDGPAKATPVEGEDAPTPKMVAEQSSGTKSVTRTGVRVKTPAGVFTGCVKVEHQRGEAIYGVKYFCPGVGLVRSEMWAIQNGKPTKLVGSQTLIEYQIDGVPGGLE